MKSKKPQAKDLEHIVGVVMTVYNGINEQAKSVFIPSDRKIFLSHLASLLESEAKLINSPVGDLVGGESDV